MGIRYAIAYGRDTWGGGSGPPGNISYGRVLGPIRNQTPVHEPTVIAGLVMDDDRNFLLGRSRNLLGSNVVTRRVQR